MSPISACIFVLFFVPVRCYTTLIAGGSRGRGQIFGGNAPPAHECLQPMPLPHDRSGSFSDSNHTTPFPCARLRYNSNMCRPHFRKLLAATVRANMSSRFLWVGSDSWGAKEHPVRNLERVAEGAITILPQRSLLSGRLELHRAANLQTAGKYRK